MRYDRMFNKLGRAMKKRQGAALVAVLLLTMVLSGLGLVAVQNTFNSMQLAGNYRLRKQAMETSNAGLLLMGTRVESSPTGFYNQVKSTTGGKAVDYVLLDKGTIQELYLGQTSSNATGLFSDQSDPTTNSFEEDQSLGTIGFDVVLRDPVEGPPPLGYSADLYCSKQMYMASRVRYDALEVDGANVQSEKNWDRPARAASGMVGMTFWVEPIEDCAR